MTILVIAEHEHGSLKGATLNVVAAAAKIGGDVHVLVAGEGCASAAAAAAQIAGVAGVIHADGASLAEQLAENVGAQVIGVVKSGSYSHVLFAATAHGKNVAPRVALTTNTTAEGINTNAKPICHSVSNVGKGPTMAA